MTETATPLLPLVLSLALAGGAALAAEMTECGQAVPAGEIGELRANLVECAAAADPLHLSARGVLDRDRSPSLRQRLNPAGERR